MNNDYTDVNVAIDIIHTIINNHIQKYFLFLEDSIDINIKLLQKQNNVCNDYFYLSISNYHLLIDKLNEKGYMLKEQRINKNHIKLNISWNLDKNDALKVIGMLCNNQANAHYKKFKLKRNKYIEAYISTHINMIHYALFFNRKKYILKGKYLSNNDLDVYCTNINKYLINGKKRIILNEIGLNLFIDKLENSNLQLLDFNIKKNFFKKHEKKIVLKIQSKF